MNLNHIFFSLLGFLFIFITNFNPILAETTLIKTQTSIEINFPKDIQFKISGELNDEIETINLIFKIGYSNSNIIQPINFNQNQNNFEGNLTWNTNTANKYIPPGSPIEYSYEIKTTSKKTFSSKINKLVYLDNNQKWNSVKYKSITMYYIEVFENVVQSRANDLLEATLQTVEYISPLLGLEAKNEPLNIVLFNDYSYMSKSLAPKSDAQSEKLITQGQAYPKHGVVLLLDGRESKGTASHEITHILVERAAGSPYTVIPSWLNEGLAEYANPIKGFSYQNSFENNLKADTLLSITKYTSPPGKPEDIILFYGQSEKIVEYMIETLGRKEFTDFIKSMQSGMSLNNALKKIYGMNKVEIENEWRKEIGASLIEETNKNTKPKSTTSSVQLYTLDSMKNDSKEVNKPTEINLTKANDSENISEDNKSRLNNKNSCGLSDSNEILMLGYFFSVVMLYKRKNRK